MAAAALHLIAGKIAAGKSTLAARLAREHGAILLSEDQWTAALWPGELTSLDAYLDRTSRLKSVLGPHVTALLKAGLTVVMDFPANTPKQRAWLRSLFEDAGAAHVLHFLDVDDAVCKARLRARNAAGQHAYAPSEAEFDLFTRYFAPPGPDERFNLMTYGADGVRADAAASARRT